MNDQPNGDRQMVSGNWTCGNCGAAITELPFTPDPERASSLLCRDCHRAKKEQGGGGGAPRGERKMYEGNWTCSGCGNTITSLPFEPRSTENLKCRDCFRK